MKTWAFALAGLLLGSFAMPAFAVDVTKTLTVETDSDKTSKDIDVKFTLQKANWTGENLVLYGKVTNETAKDYGYVEVIITAYDKEGNFITRTTTSIYPEILGSKKVGYLDAEYIETGDLIPSRLTLKFTGEAIEANDL
jgi:hypothetical protein